jgi:hypothetical protein
LEKQVASLAKESSNSQLEIQHVRIKEGRVDWLIIFYALKRGHKRSGAEFLIYGFRLKSSGVARLRKKILSSNMPTPKLRF